jgi:hypothetical protein
VTEVTVASSDAARAVREALTSLAAAVLQVRDEYGDTLGVRRLTSDVDRINADLEELGEPAPGHRRPTRSEDLLEIPDDPYDESMWLDAQSEAQHAL